MKKQVLLVCGTGASSGFMASNARKAATANNVDLSFIARSDSLVEDYIEKTVLLMVGPHLAYMLDELKEITEEYDVPIVVIDEEIYGTLDGEGLLKKAREILEV